MLLSLAQSDRAAFSPPDAGDGWSTLDQIVSTLTLQAGFNTSIVVVGTTLLGLAAGIIGVFALLRRRALVCDALSHATLPGMALAFITAAVLGADGRTLPVLLSGAAVSGVLGVLAIQLILRCTRLREDAAIGIVLSVFFGIGIVLLSVIQQMPTGNAGGLRQFIYGQTAAMSVGDAVLMGAIALLACLATVLLLKEFAVVCFNDAFARVSGWPVSLVDLGIMALVVLVTVAGLQAVGLLLVVAMLIVPPVAARFWTERLWLLVIVAGVIGGLSGYLGAATSALLPRKPAGGVIVLTSGVIFVISMVCAPARGVLAASWRRFRLRLRIAGEHILEEAFEHRGGDGQASLSAAQLRALATLRGWPRGLRRMLVSLLRLRGHLTATPEGGVVLTPQGHTAGARISRNHRLWEQYLISYADIAPSHVDWSVDQVEHVLSESLVRELEAALRDAGTEVPA
ncbi:MAG: metal ABC transporter permease [Planctomycetota bacterium]